MNWLEKISADEHQTYICKIKQGKQSITKINIYDIIYLEIQKHDISVHTAQGIYHKYGSLVNELKYLSPYGFLKCTKNCIVSLNHILSIHSDNINLIDGTQIHMSRKYAATIIIAFSQNRTFKV